MKFGKMFKKQMVPEWIEAYVDYNGLKRKLREILLYKQSKQPTTHLGAKHPKLALHRTFSGLYRSKSFRKSNDKGDMEDQVIRVNTSQQDDTNGQFYETNFLKQAEEGGDIEAMFFTKLDEELNKVNKFYEEKVEEVKREATLLNKQMDVLMALRIKVEKPELIDDNMKKQPSDTIVTTSPSSRSSTPRISIVLATNSNDIIHGIETSDSSEEEDFVLEPIRSTGDINQEVKTTEHISDPLQILERVKIKNTLETPMSTLKGVFGDSKDEELSFNKEELKKVEERLRHVFVEFYQKLRLLKHYSFMNLSAFLKILKKYEKISSRKASRAYMKIVDNSSIGSSEEVNGLLERVETTFIKHFSKSNRKEGMKSLRPKAKREKHRVTFFSGFFSGCSIALLVAVALKIETNRLMKRQEGAFYMFNILPLYSIFGYLILHMLMYAANIYFWRKYRVNYPFIFGFKQGTELGYREVFLLSNSLAVLTLTCFLANLHLDGTGSKHYNTFNELIPVGLITTVLFILFCPFDIIYCSSRFFFIRSLFLCICAPLYKVRLPDFFLADHITSQIQAIRSIDLYFCYYGIVEHSRRQSKCHKHGVYNAFYYIVAVVPYWIRFLQCIRRLCEEKDKMHALNSLKYFLTIVAVVIRTAFELKKGTTLKVLALISSAAAISLSTFWDIVVDWGLLRRQSKNKYLRDKLLVPHKSVYFAAMVLNVILRICWMQLVLEFNLRALHKMTITTVISCLEIIRRGIWSFFRLENEHLNNVGKYRAFKSVPLPFNYYDNETEKDD